MTDVRTAHLRVLLFSAALMSITALSACSGCGDEAGGGNFDSGVPVESDTGVPTEDAGSEVDSGTEDAGGGADVGPGPSDAGAGEADAGANPTNPNNATIDSDCDGLSDAEEFGTVYPGGLRTDPNNPDSDGDGISDGIEAGRTRSVEAARCAGTFVRDADPASRSSPVSTDTDGDGILDGAEDANRDGEQDANESSPISRDSDGDEIPDAIEDANRDGVRDPGELHPGNRDTDGDGVGDGVEDRDRDGVRDARETDPRLADSDGDGLSDGTEDANRDGIRQPYETDPREIDTDCDGISDGEEVREGTSPLATDSDRDGIPDSVEAGVTGAIPNSGCSRPRVDADPTTTTRPNDSDSDNDGLLDGEEDANQNGRIDAGETDPNDRDSDNDGITDGDEVVSGTDPLDPNDPGPNVSDGINMVCSDGNLKVVDFDVGGSERWTLANEQSMNYVRIGLSAAAVNTDVAALDGTGPVSGFIVRMPLIAGGPMTSVGQNTALAARLGAAAGAEQLTFTVRSSPRNIVSHDGFQTGVNGLVDITSTGGTRETAVVRNALLRMATGLEARAFTGLPTDTPGARAADFVFSYQILVRNNPGELIVVGAVLQRSVYDSVTDNGSIEVSDLTNGTSLARANARRGKDCEPYTAGTGAVADIIWMADISGSTDDDRGRIVSASQLVFNTLAANNVDFRMGVVPHTEHAFSGSAPFGELRGSGFTRNIDDFVDDLENTAGSNGCEFGLDAARQAINRALPRSARGVVNPLKFRSNAQIAVVYISDEYANEVTEGECSYDPGGAACDTGVRDIYTTGDNNLCQLVPNATQQACINSVVAPYISHLTSNDILAFGQFIAPAPNPLTCTGYACPQPMSQAQNEPGIGYVEVVNATGGTFYSPCVDNPGSALQTIVDAITGAASQYRLTGSPISSTIKVGITRLGGGGNGRTDIVPRDKDAGFDYDPVANAIFFRGPTRPTQGDLVVISYRTWLPPAPDPCNGTCTGNQVCDPDLQVCGCDQAACNACGPNQVCNANCECSCASDCNGQCGPSQVCNESTCTCQCAPNCGGSCPTGTVCDPTSCSCVCGPNCGGACDGTGLECNQAACNCQCPSDCGGQCGAGTVCNVATCSCTCDSNCSENCPGNGTCNPANNCACECPSDCGGCPDNTVCNPGSCACECPADCTASRGCTGRQQCNPNNACECYCPPDCGGCNANEVCDPTQCACIPQL